jgi:hypothetical protein
VKNRRNPPRLGLARLHTFLLEIELFYLNQGHKYVMPAMILWDYFAISSPSLPEQAGYCSYEAEQMVTTFDRLSKEKFKAE